MLLVLLNCLTESTFPSPSSYSTYYSPNSGGGTQVGGGGGGGGGGSQGHPPLYETLPVHSYIAGVLCAQAFRDSPEEQDKTRTASGGPNSRTRFYDSYSTVRRPDRSTKINVSIR